MASRATIHRREQRKRAKNRVFFGPKRAITQMLHDSLDLGWEQAASRWTSFGRMGEISEAIAANVERQRNILRGGSSDSIDRPASAVIPPDGAS